MKKTFFSIFLFLIIVNINTAYARVYDDDEVETRKLYFSFGASKDLHNKTKYQIDDGNMLFGNIVNVKPSLNIIVGFYIAKFLAIEGEYNWGFSTSSYEIKKLKDSYELYAKNISNSHSFFINIVPKVEVFDKSFLFVKLGLGYGIYNTTLKIQDYFGDPSSVDTNYIIQDQLTSRYRGLVAQIGLGIEANLNSKNSISISYNFRYTPKLQYSGRTGYSSSYYEIIPGDPKKVYNKNNSGTFCYGSIQIAYKITL